VNWGWFVESAGILAVKGEELLRSTGLCLVGTIRADGWPRISPCEVILDEGELMLGMMWRSRKALDLLRDPRLVVHSAQCDPKASHGDFKVYGRAREIPDDGIDPTRPRPSHLFAVEIESAGYISFGRDREVMRWDVERGLERIRHPNEPGAS
jgi:Pyridoxamine 5'-phosphate oxidase